MDPEYANLLITCRDFIPRNYKIDNFKEINAMPGGKRRRRLAGDFPDRLLTACEKNIDAWTADRQEEGHYESHFLDIDSELELPHPHDVCWSLLQPDGYMRVEDALANAISAWLRSQCSEWAKK